MIGRFAVAAGLLIGSGAFAHAQEGHLDWSGYYAGMMGSYGWTNGRFVADQDGLFITSNHDLDGVAIGVYAGAQRQFLKNVVLGIEVDAAYRTGSDADGIHLNVVPTWFDGQSLLANVNWTGSARARVGYSSGRWLPYLTAGIAWADYDVTHDNADPKTLPFRPKLVLQYSEMSVGWTIGVGSEYAVTDKISLRAEYRYSDFGTIDVPLHNFTIDSDYRLDTHDVTIGIGYRW